MDGWLRYRIGTLARISVAAFTRCDAGPTKRCAAVLALMLRGSMSAGSAPGPIPRNPSFPDLTILASAPQPDGTTLLAGGVWHGSGYYFAVARLAADGSADRTFNATG